MLIYKILQSFLLPSTFILAFFIAGLFLFLKKKKKWGKALLILGIGLYYLFSISPIADSILAPLESQSEIVKKEALDKADTIVILLGGRRSSHLRASQALRIYNLKNKKPEIIISGKDPLNDELTPGDEIEQYLLDRGVKPENIKLEEKSETTYENAYYVSKIVGEEPFFLVTSAFHMPRSVASFEYFDAEPVSAPSDFRMRGDYDLLDFLPSGQNLYNVDLAFHEYFGLIFYKFYYFR